MSDDFSAQLLRLKQQRGHFAAFGQTAKVKAADVEIAKLREARAKSRAAVVGDASPEVETADEDTSQVESTGSGTRVAKRKATARTRSRQTD